MMALLRAESPAPLLGDSASPDPQEEGKSTGLSPMAWAPGNWGAGGDMGRLPNPESF